MKNIRSVFLILILMSVKSVWSQYQFIGNVEKIEKLESGIFLKCGEATVQVTVLTPDLMRILMSPDGQILDNRSYAVMKKKWPKTSFSINDSEKSITIRTGKLELRIQKNPCRLAFYNLDGTLVNQDESSLGMGWYGNQVCCWKSMPAEEAYYGLGEKTGGLNKRGRRWTMWNADIPGYTDKTDPIYQSHPFFIGLNQGKAYAVFFDNTHKTTFDFGVGTDSFYSFQAVDGPMDYYFFYGPEIKNILCRYTQLTGRMPLPPRWSLGYQQCRWSYYPDSEVLRLARTFREKEIPCDVIYLDIHYMDGYRCFTWDPKRFPNPKKMLDELESMGFKVVVISDPGIKIDPDYGVYQDGIAGNHFCRMPDGSLYTGRVWPGNCHFPDFIQDKTRVWWGALHQELLADGIDGFWTDMNEPACFFGGNFLDLVQHRENGQAVGHSKVHNVYGLMMAQATYEGLVSLDPGKRPFVLTRAGFSGIQRIAAVWTGDNVASWDHLAMSIPMCLGLGLSGVPFVGADIGGFMGSPSPELMTRWLQSGVFTPLYRSHTHYNSPDQEPWAFGEHFEEINRQTIRLRYELMPYLYDAMYQSSQTGLPVIQPLFLQYQADQTTVYIDDQFLFGEDIMAAPVTQKEVKIKKVYFPEGDWIHYETGESFSGPDWISVETPLESIPMFVKAGAVIPVQSWKNCTDDQKKQPCILKVYLSETTMQDTIYDDDGLSFDFQKGYYSKTPLSCLVDSHHITFQIGKQLGLYPRRKISRLEFHQLHWKPSAITLQGREIPEITRTVELKNRYRSWNYDQATQTLLVRIHDTGDPLAIEINSGNR